VDLTAILEQVEKEKEKEIKKKEEAKQKRAQHTIVPTANKLSIVKKKTKLCKKKKKN
jgi:hypothetical protein